MRKTGALWAGLVVATVSAATIAVLGRAAERPRPKIFGIVQVQILSTDQASAKDFYYGILGTLAKANMGEQSCDWCESIPTAGPILVSHTRGPLPANLLTSVTLRTDNAAEIRNVLKKAKMKVEKLTTGPLGTSFRALDPEGHQLIFAQEPDAPPLVGPLPGAYQTGARRWPHIVHAGFIVRNRETMDHFYKDVLGFHVYWHGGMKDDETNWVDMQVPDGTDWIEYMLNVPENANQHTRGVMNHIAVGVPSVKAAAEQLRKDGVKLTEEPKVGRDGKWQLNLYDPDETRVELMEFTPVEKPCCSEYTGKHPVP